MSETPEAPEEHGRPEASATPVHDIERAVARLNQWWAEHKGRIPRRFNWRALRRERCVPFFRAIQTAEIREWQEAELERLFRVVPGEICEPAGEVRVDIEVLVADVSLKGEFLNMAALMETALDVVAEGCLLGRASPRLGWFWLHYGSFVQEMESYVSGIRMKVDARTPVQHDQRRVFEDFRVPLADGQQTAIGKGCWFVLDYVTPQGAAASWRFSIKRDDEVIVRLQVLQPKPIYLGEELLAVIKKIQDGVVTLSVLTSEGTPGGASAP